MATLHTEAQTRIEALTAFMAIMTGGVWLSDDIDTLDGGGWQWAVDNDLVVANALVPHAIMRWKDSTPHQARFPVLGAEQEVLEIYLYAPLGGYGSLNIAVSALKRGLHDTLFEGLTDRSFARCLYVFASGEMPASEYQMSPSRFVRFSFMQQR
jgi:hypothetical protein